MLAVILAAAIAFDSSMTDEEWEQTGLIKLTLQERMALQEWMEERYSKKMAAQDKKSAPVLQEVLKQLHGGEFNDIALPQNRHTA